MIASPDATPLMRPSHWLSRAPGVNAESKAKRERYEVSLAASLLAVGEALTAISCAKAADVRLSLFFRYVAVTTSASWP